MNRITALLLSTIVICTGIVLITKQASADVEGTAQIVTKGEIKGVYATDVDTDTIQIQTGYGECNGNYFEVTSATDHDMTSLASGEDFHYIYIDDSASSYPTPTIIDSTTEPSWSDSKQGWYNGDDRCIDVIYSPDSAAETEEFYRYDETKYLWTHSEYLLSNGSATDWTNLSPSMSTMVPVNAKAVKIYAWNDDTNSLCQVKVANVENTKSLLINRSYIYASVSGWIDLGTTKNIQYGGDTDDNNNYYIALYGWDLDR